MGKKNDKNGPKIDKNCAKIALFLYIFRISSLKIFRGGGHVPQCPIAGDANALNVLRAPPRPKCVCGRSSALEPVARASASSFGPFGLRGRNPNPAPPKKNLFCLRPWLTMGHYCLRRANPTHLLAHSTRIEVLNYDSTHDPEGHSSE